jgi:hypothetical protein
VSSFFLPASGSAVTIVVAVVRCSNTGAARGVMSFKTDIRETTVRSAMSKLSLADRLVLYHTYGVRGALANAHLGRNRS